MPANEPLPAGYRFLRIVLVIGGVGFCALGVFYLLGGQLVPGLFAVLVGVLELAALPLFRKLIEKVRNN